MVSSEPARDTIDRLQASLDRDVRDYPQMPGRLLHVLAPSHGIDWEGAAGIADVAAGEPLRPGARFRIASVTKPFVAASALRLVEDGRLDLDATLIRLLPTVYLDTLRAGGYEVEAITLRHLLTHTSGLYDFAASAYDPSITDGFDQAIARDPAHRWTRLEQVRFAMEHGAPYGAPGTVYVYSDTGACLVGEILELTTGRSMGEAIRELLDLERLGLRDTYLETVDPDPPELPQLAHQYEGDVDVAGIDPSVDLWGGGGLVSTCGDLARFFRALLRGEVFHEAQTLTMMRGPNVAVPAMEPSETAHVDVEDDPGNAGMFLYRVEIEGADFFGHGGFWGTAAYSCPDRDLTVVTQHGQSQMPEDFDRLEIIAEVVRALEAP